MKPTVGKQYSHNPDHFRFRRSLDWHYDMITDFTPEKPKRTKILWMVLVASVFLLLITV